MFVIVSSSIMYYVYLQTIIFQELLFFKLIITFRLPKSDVQYRVHMTLKYGSFLGVQN